MGDLSKEQEQAILRIIGGKNIPIVKKATLENYPSDFKTAIQNSDLPDSTKQAINGIIDRGNVGNIEIIREGLRELRERKQKK